MLTSQDRIAKKIKIEDIAFNYEEGMKTYYAKYFPFKEFYHWLSYGGVQKYYFPNREFSFTLGGEEDIFVRFKSFVDHEDLKKEIVRMNPKKIDIGAVYNIKVDEILTIALREEVLCN